MKKIIKGILPTLVICLFLWINPTSKEFIYHNLFLPNLLQGTIPTISYSAIDTSKVTFLDTRELEEYVVSHIPNAIWVGYDSLLLEKINVLQKNQPIIVYCSVGYRSEKVGEKLQSLGFDHVQNLEGGIFTWVNHQKNIINIKGSTSFIHPYSTFWGIWLSEGEKTYSD